MSLVFVDTNVLIYNEDASNQTKRDVARRGTRGHSTLCGLATMGDRSSDDHQAKEAALPPSRRSSA